jgi:hypothetical protein
MGHRLRRQTARSDQMSIDAPAGLPEVLRTKYSAYTPHRSCPIEPNLNDRQIEVMHFAPERTNEQKELNLIVPFGSSMAQRVRP